MKDLSSTILAAAAKQMQQDAPLIRLIEVTLPTPTPSMLRLANYDRDVKFGSTSTGVELTYSKFPVAVGEFRESRQGDRRAPWRHSDPDLRSLDERLDPDYTRGLGAGA